MKVIQLFKRLNPKKKLKILTIALFVCAIIQIILTFTSLAITASNIMITHQMYDQNQLNWIYKDYPTYLPVQNTIVAFDVLLIIALPFLLFSVFTFYTKGNMIIIIINALFSLIRWIMSVVTWAVDSDVRLRWFVRWQNSNHGKSDLCFLDSCNGTYLNYVYCGRLRLWNQMMYYELFIAIVWIPLFVIVLLLAYHTNKLDLSIVQFSQQAQ